MPELVLYGIRTGGASNTLILSTNESEELCLEAEPAVPVGPPGPGEQIQGRQRLPLTGPLRTEVWRHHSEQ